jgi:hypothetical protein
VYGSEPSHVRSTVSMKSCGSRDFASQQTNGTFCSFRNFGTCVGPVFCESSETRVTARSREGNFFAAATRSGISSRHGSHQVAQKLTTRTLPFLPATTREA